MCAVEVEGERIVSVRKVTEAPKSRTGLQVYDYGNAVIMPGLIDAYADLAHFPSHLKS